MIHKLKVTWCAGMFLRLREGLQRLLDLMLHLGMPRPCVKRAGAGRGREGCAPREIYLLICGEGSVKYVTPNVIPAVTWLI